MLDDSRGRFYRKTKSSFVFTSALAQLATYLDGIHFGADVRERHGLHILFSVHFFVLLFLRYRTDASGRTGLIALLMRFLTSLVV